MQKKIEYVRIADQCPDVDDFLHLGRDYLAEVMSERSPDGRESYLQSMLARQVEPDRWLLVMKVDGVPAGLVHAKIDRDERPGWGYILEFYVSPGNRLAGVGRSMCEHVIGILKGRGAEDVWLSAFPAAEGFWKRLGFMETGEFEGTQKIMAMHLV